LCFKSGIEFRFPDSARASGIDGGELGQSDAAFRKRLECAEGQSEPFFAASALEASRAFRFRKLSLVLSLASKKELKIPLNHLDYKVTFWDRH